MNVTQKSSHDPRRHTLSRHGHAFGDDPGADAAPEPLSFPEEVESLRTAIRNELDMKVEDRGGKVGVLGSEAVTIAFLLDEFSARTRLQIEKGEIDGSAESMTRLADDMSRLLKASLWVEDE
ncbi:hypothetical protein ACIBFB_05465 [Nocardiopsis sp. NPDC050513]|uniref:hypothetical protein n=1 Tax=Nocardiopsis sp. NPDC050513 TaxID=3364338 RepID=UPI0037973CFC